jgi:tetratricopeptide (TPR) repeat protein
MKKGFLTLLFILECIIVLNAQPDLESQFLNGKNLFNSGKYELAMQAFKDITSEVDNPYAEYSSFYYALSAYRINQRFVAKSMFLQIIERYPDWAETEEVHYWLAEIYFDEKKYILGLNETAGIKETEDIISFKTHYLNKINGLDTLQYLLEKNPYDKTIANILANKISQQPFILQDRNLLEFLVEEFELDPEQFNVANSMTTVFKEEYNVAVLFPFMSNDLNPIKHKNHTPFLLDLYQGIRVSVDSLNSQETNLKLHAFDTQGDSLELIRILGNEEFEKMDLIIGPLLPRTNQVASLFSFNKRINMVNPLSSNVQVIGNNPYSFLMMPTRETLALKTAEYAIQSFANKTVAIYYSPKDSLMAKVYKDRLEIDSFNVIIMKAVPDTLSKAILNELTDTDDYDNLRIKEDSIGHIFLVSSSELVVSNMISTIDIRRDAVPLLIRDDILKFRSISLVQLERLGVRLIAYNTINPDTENYRRFSDNYINIYGKIPSHYVFMGYELMNFFGNRLIEGGTLFQQLFNKEPRVFEGFFLNGFDYYQANSNQYIPMQQMVDSRLVIVEPGIIEEEDDNEQGEE